MKTTTEMQLVPITKLVPYVNNARTHSPEQINKLRSSLREFGFVNPVIIDRDYGVIAGHGRILAAKEEGIAEVPCASLPWTATACAERSRRGHEKSLFCLYRTYALHHPLGAHAQHVL